jgi:hypothetical protein
MKSFTIKMLALCMTILVGGCAETNAQRNDAPVMPRIEGCSVERYVVKSPHIGSEVLYVARCTPVKTTSVSTQYSCGKAAPKR